VPATDDAGAALARPPRARGMGALGLGLALALFAAGCAQMPTPPLPPASVAATSPCQAWFQALDAQVARAGVRDAGTAPVKDHAYLRVDRFTASLVDRLPAWREPQSPPAAWTLWVARMLELDRQARQHELANLPPATRRALAIRFDLPDAAAMAAYTRSCGEQRVQAELATAQQLQQLRAQLAVPDDYVGAYRLLGLYPLTRLPFLAGVRQFEAQTRQRFGTGVGVPPGTRQLRLLPPDEPGPQARDLEGLWRAAADHPLGIPLPTPEQAAQLFARHAPVFDLGIASDDDRPGALFWNTSASAESAPAVNTGQPVVYRQLAYTRYGDTSLLQLVYTLWFGARTASTVPVDLLAGPIDGLVWRVTLSADGAPWVYDSIHPCGCYHMFFPVPGVTPRTAPPGQGEWAFSPADAPMPGPGQRIVLRVAAGTHYLEGISTQAATAPGNATDVYQWRDYDTLRSLPTPDGGHRSVFGPDGIMPGTDRLESWLFWPMGIARAGAMRQWGRHATAFVGQRHFDDARLIEERFHPGSLLPGD
jgi:hypothetical protein